MAYNNGFPATYPQMYYPQQYQQPMQQPAQQTQQQTMIWVQGEAAARGYLMAPNTTLPLWDSETNTIFLKTTDAAGMPSMKILDYTIRDSAPATAPVAASMAQPDHGVDYATKADIDVLKGQINGLKMQLGKLTKKEAKEDE